MTASELYNRLTVLPLFRGVSGQDLALIADRVKMRWVTIVEGQPVIQEGEACNHLIILCEGALQRSTTYDGMTYTVTDELKAPCIIEVEQLYGLSCRYQSNYRAATTCHLLLIPKDDVRQTLLSIPIWRINLLNELTAVSNRLKNKTLPKAYNLKEMILHFASERPLQLRIRMADLGHYLGAARKTISNALHELEAEGKVELHPNIINYIY